MQHFEEEVVEDFVGWVFLQLCLQVAASFMLDHALHAGKCFAKT